MPFQKGIRPNGSRNFKDSPELINKEGRPKKLPELDKLLIDVLSDEKDGVTAAEAILRALRAKAAKGDVRAIELLLNRAYGKQIEKFEGTITQVEMPKIIIS